MEAELRGEGLDITPITPGKQFVGRQNYTRWVWSVKSREPGAKMLDAALNLVIEHGGREPMKHAIKTFKRKILVRENKTTVFKPLFKEYESIIIVVLSAFFGALFQYIFAKLSKKKNKSQRIKAAKKNRVASNSLKTIISRWVKINFFVRLFHHRTNS